MTVQGGAVCAQRLSPSIPTAAWHQLRLDSRVRVCGWDGAGEEAGGSPSTHPGNAATAQNGSSTQLEAGLFLFGFFFQLKPDKAKLCLWEFLGEIVESCALRKWYHISMHGRQARG